MHGEGEEDQKRHGAAQIQVAPESLLQIPGAFVRFHPVDGPQRSHDHFSGGQGGDESDADLPIESKGLDDRFDGPPHGPDDAFGNRGGFSILARETG